MAELEDDNKQDLSVWDLAQRLVDGFPVSSAAEEEVGDKWREMRGLLLDLANQDGLLPNGAIDYAKELVDMNKQLRAALGCD